MAFFAVGGFASLIFSIALVEKMLGEEFDRRDRDA